MYKGLITAGIVLMCLTNNLAETTMFQDSLSTFQNQQYYDSIEYVAMCVEAEASNQGYEGKQYVADCIFNRYDYGNYSNYYEVINEPGQFACVDNCAIMCEPTEETWEVVRTELFSRTNSEILYFRTDRYHAFGTPCFRYKDHYFSK